MSVELLNDLKQKAHQLSPQEIESFVDYLQEIKPGSEKDLGLSGDDKVELRRLHKLWLKKNRTQFAGQYVALNGAEVVGIGKTRLEAAQKAKEKDFVNVFIVYVYPIDYVGEMGS